MNLLSGRGVGDKEKLQGRRDGVENLRLRGGPIYVAVCATDSQKLPTSIEIGGSTEGARMEKRTVQKTARHIMLISAYSQDATVSVAVTITSNIYLHTGWTFSEMFQTQPRFDIASFIRPMSTPRLRSSISVTQFAVLHHCTRRSLPYAIDFRKDVKDRCWSDTVL